MSCFMEFGNPAINSLSLLNWSVGQDRQHIILSSTTFIDERSSKKSFIFIYTHRMNVKKMFAASTGVLMLATLITPAVNGAANYGAELTGAYEYAFSKGITTMSSIDNANMYGEITRGQLAKMISNWAEKELGTKVDATKVCSFTDANTAEGDLAAYLTKSCQMGLMGQGIDAFRPNSKVTRAEFGTVLSRALWGNKYEGATPYYANHLQALKDAGIMTKIETPSQLEIRGYVMLMLQRSATESLIKNVTNTGTNNTGVVKAGDLKVTANAATNRRIIENAVSDLDTITLAASQDVTLDKVVLERYGYSSKTDIETVWLENSKGEKITNDGHVNSKDEVSLNIKREYKAIGKKADLTIVVKTANNTVNKTIGFKVKAVESSAKNLDLSSYTPFTYDVVVYDGSKVTVEMKGSNRSYHYAANKMYEVARLQVKPTNGTVVVKGFSLKNTGNLALDRYLDKVEVTVDGKALSNVSYSVNRDKDLVVSFADREIEMRKNATFVVNVSFKTLDRYGETVTLLPRDASAINAVEAKTQTRVSIQTVPTAGKTYTFNGSEVRLTNGKNITYVDAAAGSDDVVFGSGTVTVSDVVNMGRFSLVASHQGIETLTMVVGNESFDADRAADKVTFTFKDVVLEKNAAVRFEADLADDAVRGTTIAFTPSTFGRNQFANAQYDESREAVGSNVIGSITLSSIKVQAAKGSLTRNNSRDVEFVNGQTADRVVFEGTYTAQKQDVTLKSVVINGTALDANENLEFHVYVDGTEVGSEQLNGTSAEIFVNDVVVAKGKSVPVKVVANGYFVKDATHTTNTYNYNIEVKGEDKDGNAAGVASASFVTIKNVDTGSVTVTDTNTNRSNVVLKSSNITLGKFVVKSTNKASETNLENFKFTLNGGTMTADDYSVRVNGTEATDVAVAGGVVTVSNLSETIGDNGVEIEIVAKKELAAAEYSLTLTEVNGTPVNRTVNKKVVDVLVRVVKMENLNGDTRYTLAVDEYESGKVVTDLVFKYKNAAGTVVSTDPKANISNGETFTLAGDPDYNWTITEVEYKVDGHVQTIKKADYEDYFAIDGTALKIFRS